MKNKNIAVVSGTRADFNYFRLILKKIIQSKSLNLSLLITGMHLLALYGKTKELIEKENIPIAGIVEMYDENDITKTKLGVAVGKGVINFTKVLNKIKPDFLLVLGDRYEALASVIAASTLLIPIAHIHGGDNSYQGQIDEQIRHSITKFSHIHFPATEKSAKRIRLLGEEDWRIHMVGSPSIDHVYHENFLIKEEICNKLGLKETEKLIICIQHPYTIEPDKAGEQMRITLKVLSDLNLQCVVIYPNNDPGSNLIIDVIKNYDNFPNFKIFKNLNYFDYYSLMKNADLMVGNSSGGSIETPIFKLPAVNIGDRNKGRESAENVINVGYNYNEIYNGIKKGLSDEFKAICAKVKNPYGEGTASDEIVRILEDIEIKKKLLIKKLTYHI